MTGYMQEMGLTAEELEFFCVNSGPSTHYIYPNGDEVSNIEIIYLCRKWTGTPRSADGEMTDLRFYSAEEVDIEEVSPPIRNVVEKFLQKHD